MNVYFQCCYVSKKWNGLQAKSKGKNEKHGWIDGLAK